MSNRPQKLIVNCETGVSEYIDLTDEEIAFNEEQAKKFELEEAKAKAETEAKAEAKASALAKLQELGLTEEEAIAIVGN